MMKYYFLMCAVPKLVFGVKPEISFEELQTLLSFNLTPTDAKQVIKYRSYIDLMNLKAFWKGVPLNFHGNLNAKELEEALLVRDFFPEFVFDFVDEFESLENRIKNFSKLVIEFYRDICSSESGFLKEFFSFERECKLVMAYLRSKRLNRNLAKEFKFEELSDFFVSKLLKGEEDSLPLEYKSLEDIFIKYEQFPEKLNFYLMEYRFSKIQSRVEREAFGLDQVLGYLSLFMIAEEISNYDKVDGRKIVEALL